VNTVTLSILDGTTAADADAATANTDATRQMSVRIFSTSRSIDNHLSALAGFAGRNRRPVARRPSLFPLNESVGSITVKFKICHTGDDPAATVSHIGLLIEKGHWNAKRLSATVTYHCLGTEDGFLVSTDLLEQPVHVRESRPKKTTQSRINSGHI
jgi:hypothetical protein